MGENVRHAERQCRTLSNKVHEFTWGFSLFLFVFEGIQRQGAYTFRPLTYGLTWTDTCWERNRRVKRDWQLGRYQYVNVCHCLADERCNAICYELCKKMELCELFSRIWFEQSRTYKIKLCVCTQPTNEWHDMSAKIKREREREIHSTDNECLLTFRFIFTLFYLHCELCLQSPAAIEKRINKRQLAKFQYWKPLFAEEVTDFAAFVISVEECNVILPLNKPYFIVITRATLHSDVIIDQNRRLWAIKLRRIS